MFNVSEAKKKVLKKLVEKDWTPTELAEELNQTTQTTYNHLNQLEEKGLLEKKKVEAKTRPKTLYSIGKGFLEYIAALPGDLTVKSLKLTDNKRALFRVWSIPQPEFHPYLEKLWHKIKEEEKVLAFGVYGSVARGEADQDSDIDVLLVTKDKKEELKEKYGSTVIEIKGGNKLVMAKTFSLEEYRNSLVHGSDFLLTLIEEIVPIYDPEGIIWKRASSRVSQRS